MRLRNHVVLGSTVLTAIASAGMSQEAIALPLADQPDEQPNTAIQVSQEALPIPIPVIEPDVQRISQTTSVDEVTDPTDPTDGATPNPTDGTGPTGSGSNGSGSTSGASRSGTPQVNQVRAKVVDVSNEGDVLVRLPNGNYQRLSRVNPSVLSKLDPGDEVILTTVNNNVLNVALVTDDIQQASIDDDNDVEVETEQRVEEQTVERTTQTETTTQRQETEQIFTQPRPQPRPQPLPTAPVPVVPPAPAALW